MKEGHIDLKISWSSEVIMASEQIEEGGDERTFTRRIAVPPDNLAEVGLEGGYFAAVDPPEVLLPYFPSTFDCISMYDFHLSCAGISVPLHECI